jgi:hypothetical protein
MAIKVETTTDSVDDVKRSVGDDVVVEAPEDADKDDAAKGDESDAGKGKDDTGKPDGKKPAGADKKPAGAPAKDKADKDNEESEENDEDEDESDESEGKDAKDKSEEPHKKNRPNRYRRRIDKLERELERTREELVRVANPKGGATEDTPEPKAPASYSGKPKPKRGDFADAEDPDADFHEALGRWGAAEEIAKTEFERNDKEARSESQKLLKAYTGRVADAKTLIPDFDEAFDELENDLPITPAMQYVIFTSEIGPFISHYLALHPKRAAEIADMEGPDVIRAMGRVEAIVEAQVEKLREEAKKGGDKGSDKSGKSSKESEDGKEKKALTPPKKTVSNAPPPPNTVKGANAAPKTLKDIAGTDERLVDHVKFNPDYERMRKEQRRGRSA